MAKNTANVAINIINNAQSVSPPPFGTMYVLGETLMGEVNNPEDIITSFAQFERKFGGVINATDFPLACKQALEAGASLRVCKISGAGAAKGISDAIVNAEDEELFYFTSKGVGTYYNDLTVAVEAAPDGVASHWNLRIVDPTAGVTELYENLSIPTEEWSEAPPYTYLKAVVDGSKLVDVVYEDHTAFVGTAYPVVDAYTFTTGANGAAPTITEYTGSSSAKTGFYAFDHYDDGWTISVPILDDNLLAGLYNIGKAYATLRKDLIYFHNLDLTDITTTDITTELGTLAESKFAGCFGGGLKVSNLLLGGVKSMHALGELLGVVAKSHALNGVWTSPTAYANGIFPDSLGVVTNFGSPASYADLNLISNAGGNMVVEKNATTMLWDAYSMASADSPEKFLTVVFLEIYLMKTLKPTLERYLGKANTFSTWKEIYYTVRPFLEDLVSQEAFFEYKWDGDQFAQSLGDLQINDPDDVGNGIYKVQLQVKLVVPIVEITIDIILTRNSVEFV